MQFSSSFAIPMPKRCTACLADSVQSHARVQRVIGPSRPARVRSPQTRGTFLPKVCAGNFLCNPAQEAIGKMLSPLRASRHARVLHASRAVSVVRKRRRLRRHVAFHSTKLHPSVMRTRRALHRARIRHLHADRRLGGCRACAARRGLPVDAVAGRPADP